MWHDKAQSKTYYGTVWHYGRTVRTHGCTRLLPAAILCPSHPPYFPPSPPSNPLPPLLFRPSPSNLVTPSYPLPMLPSLCPPLTLFPLSLKSVRCFQICRQFVTTWVASASDRNWVKKRCLGLPQNWGIFLTYFTPPCPRNVLHTFCHRPLTCSRHLISAVSSHF